jgi:hypothetical protein
MEEVFRITITTIWRNKEEESVADRRVHGNHRLMCPKTKTTSWPEKRKRPKLGPKSSAEDNKWRIRVDSIDTLSTEVLYTMEAMMSTLEVLSPVMMTIITIRQLCIKCPEITITED